MKHKDRQYAVMARSRISGKLYGIVHNRTMTPTASETIVTMWCVERVHTYRSTKYAKEEVKKKFRLNLEREHKRMQFMIRRFNKKHNSNDVFECFIVRIGTNACPVRINWKEYHEKERLRVFNKKTYEIFNTRSVVIGFVEKTA